jgi:hypothetical protein
MSLRPPPGRDDYLYDLTRWNRAGLSRFQYVDGDAAVWLEELRIAMLGMYLRGIDPADRTPEQWRDLFMKKPQDWKLAAAPDVYKDAVAWEDLLPAFPQKLETAGLRNTRLIDQYNRQSPDYAWETMRAFARAVHIMLGYVNAYANEGYLRTATQWDNLRKLAAMVNYQPAPPASATALVALEIEADKQLIEVARGLAMKYAPPAGGPPLIFETLKPVKAHPDLNAARAVDWDHNAVPLNVNANTNWLMPDDAELMVGDLGVLTRSGVVGEAVKLTKVERHQDTGRAILAFDPGSLPQWQTGFVALMCEPDDVRLGLPKTVGGQLVIKLENAASYSSGTIVEVSYGNNFQSKMLAVVAQSTGSTIRLIAPNTTTGTVKVEAFTPYAPGNSGIVETPLGTARLYYQSASNINPPVFSELSTDIRKGGEDDDWIARKHARPGDAVGMAYARSASARLDVGEIIEELSVQFAAAGKSVRFEGKPPKSLEQGDWFVARPIGSAVLTALRVSMVHVEAETYHLVFTSDPPQDHDRTEFFGPMKRALRPVDHDRSQTDAVTGGITELKIDSAEAQGLVKAGGEVIIVNDEADPIARQVPIKAVEPVVNEPQNLKVTFEGTPDFTGWKAGWTRFHLNTVTISHGETKDPKTLGSGDAERVAQTFQFKPTGVSFIPSNASVTGVVPDMDVTVDGVKWEFRDHGDPTADGTDTWSVVLNDDDTLQIGFRRRLPTGTNNIAVSRHRIGVGLAGTGVPPFSFTKPMKKNRFVSAVVQPFATAGGAEREPVADIRENAPSQLAANGRAVSLKDIERLCRNHSSVWQANSRETIVPGPFKYVDVIIVPAGGGPVTDRLATDLIDFVESRALPTVRLSISGYQELTVQIHVKIRVDSDRYELSDVKDAAEAELNARFSLQSRKLGQTLYTAEILATAERVEGVSSVTITDFSLAPNAPPPLREAHVSGALAAIVPTEQQVAIVSATSGVTVDVEAAS